MDVIIGKCEDCFEFLRCGLPMFQLLPCSRRQGESQRVSLSLPLSRTSSLQGVLIAFNRALALRARSAANKTGKRRRSLEELVPWTRRLSGHFCRSYLVGDCHWLVGESTTQQRSLVSMYRDRNFLGQACRSTRIRKLLPKRGSTALSTVVSFPITSTEPVF